MVIWLLMLLRRRRLLVKVAFPGKLLQHSLYGNITPSKLLTHQGLALILKMQDKNVSKEIISKMSVLATSGFGLVAALAWNNVIQEAVNEYIKPFIGVGSGLVSLLIYAVVITILAVIITLNLSRLEQKFTRRMPG